MKKLTKAIICLSAMALLVPATASAQEHKIPELSDYFTPATSEPVGTDKDGFIQRWTILEPIATEAPSNRIWSDDYLKKMAYTEYFKDQWTVAPKDGDKVSIGKEKHIWHALDAKKFFVNLLRFSDGYGKPYYGQIWWVYTIVNCEEEIRDVRMASGANSAAMWWLNGEEVLMLSNDRDLIMDDMMSRRLTLNKGENIIRGVVFNGPGMADFCLRFVDENGKPVNNISVTTVPPKKKK